MIIDELFVKIGLDQRDFDKGQRDAVDQFRRTQESFLKGGENIENSAGRAGASVGQIKTAALELFAVFAGGKSLMQFTANLTHANAELGRTSQSTNASVQDISKWQNAARLTGGEAGAMASNFVKLSDAFVGFKLGQTSPLLSQLRSISAAGGTVIETTDSVSEALVKLSANIQAVEAKTPGEGGFLLRGMGLDAGTISLLLKGPEAVKKVLAEVSAASQQQVDEFSELERRWNKILLAGEKGGRALLSQIPATSDQLFNQPATDLFSSAKKQFAEQYEANGFWGAAYNLVSGNAGPQPTSARTTPGLEGNLTNDAQIEAYIRRGAAARGLDPDVMVQVWNSEGRGGVGPSKQSTVIKANGQREESFGPYQLFMGGGLGNDFQTKTGLDPRDPSTFKQQIDFSLDHARQNGLGPWHGWKGSPFAGGAGQGGGNTTTIQVTGPIHIQAGPNATGADAAHAFKDYLGQQAMAAQSGSGSQ